MTRASHFELGKFGGKHTLRSFLKRIDREMTAMYDKAERATLADDGDLSEALFDMEEATKRIQDAIDVLEKKQ